MKLLFELVPEAMLVFPKIPSSSWYCLKIGSSAELSLWFCEGQTQPQHGAGAEIIGAQMGY